MSFDPDDFAQVEELRKQIEGQLAFWVGQAAQCGFVPEMKLEPTEKLVMGQYSISVSVRPGIHVWRKFFNEYDKKGTSS